MTTTNADRLLELRALVASEHATREQIRKSDKFLSLQAQIVKLTENLSGMTAGIADHSAEYTAAEKAMIAEMAQTGVGKIGNIVAHYRKTNAVNGSRLYRAVGEDIGLFMEIATVSQKALKEFAKGNPDLKDELLGCIEETGQVIDSLTFLDS